MIALDINILARFLLKDDAVQCRQVCELLSRHEVYTAPPTVMLELVWVLENSDYTRAEVSQGLRGLLGLPNFKPHSFEAIFYAINWYESGMDFGDALHLALSGGEQAFVTFDKALGKFATQQGAVPKVQVLRRTTK